MAGPVWERATPFLEEALAHAHGTHLLEDVAKGVAEGRLQLWVGERCAGVSEILTFPRRRALNLFLAGGDLAELRTLQPGVEAFARGAGCSMMLFSGRLTGAARRASGWSRIWPDYQPNWISLSKDLT
jgi:hypothetical protein